MFLDFHTHKYTHNAEVLSIYNVILGQEDPYLYADRGPVSVGIHPWHPSTDPSRLLQLLEEVVGWSAVKCIGEAGLDVLKGGNMEQQIALFAQQVRLAEGVGKPVVVHCVRAFDLLLGMQRKERFKVPLIIHGFNRKPGLAEQLLASGFFLSFGGAVLQHRHVEAALMKTPLERLFLETDGPSSFTIQEIYSHVARLKEVSVEKLKYIILQNYTNL